jgi:hypothetical protein
MKTILFALVILTSMVCCQKIETVTATEDVEITETGRFSWEYIENEFVMHIKDLRPEETVYYQIQPKDDPTPKKMKNDSPLPPSQSSFRKKLVPGIDYDVVVHIFSGDSLKNSLVKTVRI